MIHTTGIYTLTEILKELDICRETFHNMRDRGLRVFKINRRVFVSGVEILRFMKRLAELAASLPRGLHSDWRGTNHYELTSVDLGGIFRPESPNPCETEGGQRLGLLMDIAEEVARLRDSGVFGE